MTIINKRLSVVCPDKKCPIFPFRLRWAHLLVFQLFFVLFVIHSPAWAGLSSLSVDANGDSVFNGTTEKLTITFTTSDFGEDTQKYTYIIKTESNGNEIIIAKSDEGTTIEKNQTVRLIWDGAVKVTDIDGKSIRQALPDGVYTITVELTDESVSDDPDGSTQDASDLTKNKTARLDKTKPTIEDVSVGKSELSSNLDSESDTVPVSYTLSEDVKEAWLEILRSSDSEPIGRRIQLPGVTKEVKHTFEWDGKDGNNRNLENGSYRLKLSAIDYGGNTDEIITEQITIDSEQPRITGITINDSIPLINGSFFNTSIQTIGFTADAGGGTPLDFNTSKIQIKPINGTDLSGALTVTGNNKAEFTLGNPLDNLSENGNYEVTVSIFNSIGTRASSTANFTFDNTAPTLISLKTNREEFTQGSGLSGRTSYVEAELEDNIELDLPASSIRLKSPDGSLVLGEQTQISSNKIRWQLRAPLLATDGIQDGQYTVEIIGADKANNRTEAINIAFIFDNLAPELVSLQPTRDGPAFDILGDTTYYNLPLNQFVATFSDGEAGIGVLFTGSQDITNIIFGTPKSDGGIDVISGRAFVDKDNNVLTYILDSPLLSTDGSQDGTYLISIKATDALGNFNTINYQLIYDTQVPTVTSTLPAANQTVSNLTEVVVKLNEETSEIDFAQSNYRLTRSIGENQVEVPVNISSNGTDTVTLTLLQQIALDGSDDGTYTIEVTPADNAGNVGAAVRRPFYLVSTTQPKIRLTAPQTGTVSNITDVSAVIENYIGAGINYDESTIIVTNANGVVVPDAKVEHDVGNNQLTWSTETAIPRNGTADGEYVVSVFFEDFTGERYTQTFPLLLDTQYPSIETVETVTEPLGSLSIDSAIDVNQTFSQINVTFAEDDIDFEDTVISLVGPDSTEIAFHRSNDGDSVLSLNFRNLSSIGTYTFSVTPTDRIGNIAEHPYVYKFDLEIAVPVVATVLIGGKSGGLVYVDDSVDEIIATLVDSTGTGLAVGDSESRIVVTSGTGLPVPGTTVLNDEDQQNWQLIWRPTVLPTDGSADGTYTVSVTPVDNAGRTGDVAFRGFVYDTQEPRVTSASPVTLHQPVSYLGGSFPQLQFTIEDVGPAQLDLDTQSITLAKVDGEVISGQVTHDGVNQFFFTLSAPLPADGSADGEYLLTVDLIDRSGNSHQVQHNIFYDSQAPLISTVSLNTDTPLDLIPFQVTDLSESVNRITVNFVESTRVDFENSVFSLIGPDGADIPFNLENNGVDQLTANFVSLIQDGLYTLSITSQDITGNSARGKVLYPFSLEFAIPRLSAVKASTSDTLIDLIPHQIVYIDDVINHVTLTFTDPTRLDFEDTSVELLTPDGQQISLIQEAFIQEEGDLSQLSVRFISITENGLYTLRVTPQDIAGNIAQTAVEYKFQLNIALPSVSSVLIEGQLSPIIYLNDAITTIVATFIEPAGVGLDFSDDRSSITVTNESGVEVVGITQSNDLNQLTWMPLLFPTDGSIDGIYNVSVTPVDKVGRTGKVVNRQFIYDTQAPRITAASPIELHQPTTYVGGSLTQFQITIEDVGPALLDLDSQEITLHQSDGEDVSGVLTHDNSNQLYFTLSTPLPTDGSADGEYGLTVKLVDNAGNSDQAAYKVYYDSQAPSISTVTLNTETPLNLTPYKVTELTETVSKLTLRFVDSTRMDFANTNVMLTAPNGTEIPLTITDNGVDELTANFVTLTQGGEYTLSVTPQDITGNVAKGAVLYLFSLDFLLPGLTSVKAETTNDTVPLTPYEIVEVTEAVSSFILEFTDVQRIDIEETNVVLSGPDGEGIDVSLEEGDDSDIVAPHLVVRFVPLTRSGTYRLSITPQDTLGNVAPSATTYQFQLDLQVPAITSVNAKTTDATIALTPFEIIDITETVNSIGIGFSDVKRIDIEETNVVLSGPDGEGIVVSLEEGEGSEIVVPQLIVRFVPLTRSGTYNLSITQQDTLGNVAPSATTYQFQLDLQVPAITSVNAKTTDATIALTPFEIIDITETVNSIGIGFSDVKRIDIEETNVVLSGPDGEGIVVSLEEGEGSEIVVPQLIVRFVPLTRSGTYNLSITQQDTLGNVAPSATTYQFQLDLQVPAITSVNAKTTDATIALTPFEIIDITETVNSIGIGFSDVQRIDIEETNVVLSGPDGEGIVVSLEEGEGSEIVAPQLVVRFVPLTRSGTYNLSITQQDTLGNVAPSATTYQFQLDLQVPAITSVNAKTTDATIALTPFEIIDITETVNSIGIGFSDVQRIDIEETNVVLSGPDGEGIVVSLEEGEGSEIVAPQLVVRFVPLTRSGTYNLSITQQDTLGNVAPSATTYQFQLDLQVPAITSVNAKTTDATIALTPFEIIDITETVNSIAIGFSDVQRIDIEETNVALSGPDGEGIDVSLEEGEGSEIVAPQLVVRFVPLTRSGTYNLSITQQDTLGNVAPSATTYQFQLDLQVPAITSVNAKTTDATIALTPFEIIDITETVNSIAIGFSDVMRIDIEETNVVLSGPDGEGIVVSLEEGEGSEIVAPHLVVRFVPLTRSGTYNLSITQQDTLGNVAPSATTYQFQLDLQVPAITSVNAKTTDAAIALSPFEIIDITETVNSIGIGFSDVKRIDIEETNVVLSGPDGEGIDVSLEEGEGSDIVAPHLVVRFVPLTRSGTYNLSITQQDTLGNVAPSATTYQFQLDLKVPAITSVNAKTTDATIALTPFEIIDITETVNSIGIGFSDVMRIDIEETNVVLSGPDGEGIDVSLEEGEGSDIVAPQLIVRFVPLAQSGRYRLSITPQDTLGNVAPSATTYQFRLDLQVPAITSVNANIVDTQVALTLYEEPIISHSFSSFTLEFTDAENLDDENTLIGLSGPNGQEIAVTLEKGEDSKYVVRFVALTENGLYTLSVTPQDKAGNVGQSVYQYQFRIDIALPTVQSISIDGKLGATVYVSNSTPRIIASLTDALDVGLSFGDNGSTISVTDSNDLQVPGTTTMNDSNQLIWIPIPFATDGTADGRYNVAVTPVDMTGRSGPVVNRNFIYDSQAPRITAASPITLHAPVSYVGSGLSEFVLTIADEGPAGFFLLSQVVALTDASGKPVPAAITHNDLTDQLYLTLSTPFANDGSADGTYTLNVALVDKAGNRKTLQYTVVYDSRTPQISSVQVNTAGAPKDLVANEVTELSESISTITLSFSEATRVDFANTVVSLLDPSDLSVALTIEDDGVSEMTIRFPKLTEIGQYNLSVTPRDITGNTATSPTEYTFNLEFILPTVESIQIGDTVTLGSGDIAYVNADNLVIVANLLDPADTGLSFDLSTGSSISVTTLDGIVVFGSTGTNNSDVLVWEPITLSTDGSSDGRYAVYVRPVDKEGRQGNTVYREFILDTQEPEITSASPINLSQPVSYMSESLTQLQFTVQDVGPADLLLEDQQISLRNQSGVVIPTKLTNDSQNQLYLTLNEPLPLDGSMDGEYTVVIAFTDKAGNMLSVEHPIIYDTQAPTLVSTVPDDGELLTEDLTQIVVNLNDEGDSGIDWSNTTVTLIDPNDVEISGDVSSNGKTQLTLNTNQLVADGKYIIRVKAVDRAGNGSLSVFESSFLLSRLLPAVISTVPITAPEDEAYINEAVEQIEVMLQTVDVRHLSTVRLLNADGQVVAGQQHREPNKLIYQLVRPLATDGSEDGVYTIEFTPISASGRSGEVQSMTFTYDTQVPELITDDIQLVVAEPEVNNSLVEIRVPITDLQAGIDWENLDDEWFTFEQFTPHRTEITGRLSYDGEQNTLIFRLNVPLADNGSADGEYRLTIIPIDKAGNGDEIYEKEMTYDTSPPVIDPNMLLLNNAPLLTDIDAVEYPSAISTSGGVVIQASITDVGLGVNLSQSSITIVNPNGQEISGTSQQNGVDTIVFKSDGLNIEGIYQVTITGTGNDSEFLGFAPKASITAAFLYETTEPTGSVTNDGGKTEFTDEAIPFEGTAADPQGSRRAGQQGENEVPVPASGVFLVEIVGTGPDGQEIEPVPAEDDSNAQGEPWSSWSVDFLPTRSGEYDLDLRVTDKAGNYTVYDIGEYTMSVSFSFKGNTFGWPNPLRKSKDGVAFFSFDLNAPVDEAIDMTLYIYDWGGDLVYKQKYANITTGQRDDTRIKWNLKNQAGNSVARGLYVFRLEAVNGAGNRANAVGKVLVVD